MTLAANCFPLANRPAPKKTRQTERGKLMRNFLDRLNPSRVLVGIPPLTMGRMGKLMEQIPTCDLYALKSKCEDAKRRGFSFSKRFGREIKPSPALDRSSNAVRAFSREMITSRIAGDASSSPLMISSTRRENPPTDFPNRTPKVRNRPRISFSIYTRERTRTSRAASKDRSSYPTR
ncbi:MAG: hypothetical protein AB7P43_14340, partial [Methylocystis sp.]|uniref:hypothetical protein n=1 Tax=Methylocystis sp. TaxID=1911079 RepID=UPI003D1481FE